MDYDAVISSWQAFVEYQPVDGRIRPFVLRSWERSQAAGVHASTENPAFRRVPEVELSRRFEARHELVAVAEPHLQWVSASLAAITHAIYLTDQDGIVLASEGAQSMIEALGLTPGFDWSESQMGTNGAGTALASGQPAAVIGAEHYIRAFRDAICTGAPIHAPDGTLLGAIDLSTSLQDGNPERLSLVAHLAFAIESELARRELEREQRWLANVVEASDDAILSKTFDGTITSWNGGAERLYGYTESEIIGRNISLLVPDEQRDELEAIRAKLRRGEHVDPIETRRTRKDGRILDVSLQVSAIRNEAGEPVGATAVARDVTRRKQAEAVAERERTAAVQRADQLQRLTSLLTQTEQQERDKLAQVLHDDLQQVLVAARIKVGLLHDTDAADANRIGAQLAELLDEAIGSARSLSHDLSPKVLHDHGLAEALRWLAPRKKERYGLDVHLTIDADAEPKSHDLRILLFQAVRELLLNVLKHSSSAEAWLRMGRAGHDQVQIEVEDRGPGFDPQQLDEDCCGQNVGLGGLREKLRALGGEVRIDSAPGKRSCITLLAPINDGPSRTPIDVDAQAKRTG